MRENYDFIKRREVNFIDALRNLRQVEGEIDPKFIKSAILTDNLWGIEWELHGVPFKDSETPQEVIEVSDILDMWIMIEASYDKLSNQDKQRVKEDAYPFGDNPKFKGFDGNHEASYINVAHFLIDELNRFQEFKGRNLNSHSPSIESYRRMLQVYKSLDISMMINLLGVDKLIQILKERIHPENR